MIGEPEIRQHAAVAKVDPMVIDLDYGLSWFLAGLFSQEPVTRHLVFKGGTCLRKCYFPGYRFSEDLDFTLQKPWRAAQMQKTIEAALPGLVERGGPDFNVEPIRWETINDEYGRASYQARVYFRGPLRWGGPPHSIRLDISQDEILGFPVQPRALIHGYSDATSLPPVQPICYGLDEMAAEKLRALCGQRRYAIARDLYDLHHLVEAGVDVLAIRDVLPAKFAIKGIQPTALAELTAAARRQAFAGDWERRLAYLLPADATLSFDTAWHTFAELVMRVLPS